MCLQAKIPQEQRAQMNELFDRYNQNRYVSILEQAVDLVTQTSSQDITVFKWLNRCNISNYEQQDLFKTPWRNKLIEEPWLESRLYASGFWRSYLVILEIGSGIHAYVDKQCAIKAAERDAGYVAEAIIPAGTPFILGYYREIVADTIIFTGNPEPTI